MLRFVICVSIAALCAEANLCQDWNTLSNAEIDVSARAGHFFDNPAQRCHVIYYNGGCASNYYFKKSLNGGTSWTGVQGGTGCMPISVWEGVCTAHQSNASAYRGCMVRHAIQAGYCCTGTAVSTSSPTSLPPTVAPTALTTVLATTSAPPANLCHGWNTLSNTEIDVSARAGHFFDNPAQRCRLIYYNGGCASNYYLKRSVNGGASWTGVQGGSGCMPISTWVNVCTAHQSNASAYRGCMVRHAIQAGYCCTGTAVSTSPPATLLPTTPPQPTIAPTALTTVVATTSVVPPGADVCGPANLNDAQLDTLARSAFFVTSDLQCRVAPCSTCSCDFYLKKSTDGGESWSEGAMGGTGCMEAVTSMGCPAYTEGAASRACVVRYAIDNGYCCSSTGATPLPDSDAMTTAPVATDAPTQVVPASTSAATNRSTGHATISPSAPSVGPTQALLSGATSLFSWAWSLMFCVCVCVLM